MLEVSFIVEGFEVEVVDLEVEDVEELVYVVVGEVLEFRDIEFAFLFVVIARISFTSSTEEVDDELETEGGDLGEFDELEDGLSVSLLVL